MADEESEGVSTQNTFKLPQNITQEDIDKKAIDLVRLAISNNVTDVPLKREEIKKKVIKDNMRIFPVVFEEAQKILRSVYSMELVEYPTRGTTIHSLNQSNSQASQRDTSATQGSQASSSQALPSKRTSSKKYTTNSYILRNLIPGKLRKGLLFNEEDYQIHGLLTIILCLVYVNGNRIKEDALYRYLEKFGLYRNNQHKVFGDVEKCIYQFIQKGYLEKGTLFFQDRTLTPGMNDGTVWLKQWMTDPLPETKELRFWKEESHHEMESSTVVIHKTKALLGLLNTCKLNEYRYRHDVIYKMVYGEKETYWMGFDMARQHYYMNPVPCAFVGDISESFDKKFKMLCGHNGHLLENGKLLFWNDHLIKDKNKHGANMKIVDFNYYYLDHGDENWSPNLDCILISSKTYNETIQFNEEEAEIMERIINREKQVHYLIPEKEQE